MPDSLCVVCHTKFPSMIAYNIHMAYHCKSSSPLSPVRTTGRTKAQIVEAVETHLKPFIVDGTRRPIHVN